MENKTKWLTQVNSVPNDKIGFIGMGNISSPIKSDDKLTIKGNDKIQNCIFIGFNAGCDIKEGKNITIIGDDITTDSLNQKNVLIINPDNNLTIIGEKLFGVPINIKELIERYFK